MTRQSDKLEINSESCQCYRCGTKYPSKKGFFSACYGNLYKGIGYIPYCKKCIEDMYNEYLAVCKEPSDAVRQMCRKLNLYWNQKIFEAACSVDSTRTIMTSYIIKINTINNSGKSYDTTLSEEGTLWLWPTATRKYADALGRQINVFDENDVYIDNTVEINSDVVSFWGPGYTPQMYKELEQRLQYYRSKMPDISDSDMNTEMLLRQIAMMEIDINKARAEGRPVDKMTNSLSSLLNALQKPKKDDVDSSAANTPFGVWIKRWEDLRPIPEPDEEMKDVDGIVRYISIWFLGHLCKMLGIKNTYCKLYEDEIAKLRVSRPEYDEEDDETLFNDIFSEPLDE